MTRRNGRLLGSTRSMRHDRGWHFAPIVGEIPHTRPWHSGRHWSLGPSRSCRILGEDRSSWNGSTAGLRKWWVPVDIAFLLWRRTGLQRHWLRRGRRWSSMLALGCRSSLVRFRGGIGLRCQGPRKNYRRRCGFVAPLGREVGHGQRTRTFTPRLLALGICNNILEVLLPGVNPTLEVIFHLPEMLVTSD